MKRKSSTFYWSLAAVVALVIALPATAGAQTFHIDIPLAETVTNPCNGDDVVVQGQLSIDIQQNFDQTTGGHFDIHNLSKGTCVGVVSGANYTFSEETENSLQIPGPPQTVAQDFVLNHLLIANGNVPNFALRARLHTTLNAAGIPTASVDRLDMACH